jgi:hypothetical protein
MTLTASTSEGPQGTVVRLSGTGCLVYGGRAEWLVAGLRSVFEDERWYSYSPPAPEPHADGLFDFEMTVPPEAFRGEYEIFVTCGESDIISAGERVPFTVTGDPATYAGLAVWPLTVRPGADVGFGGEHCTGPDDTGWADRVTVDVWTPAGRDGVPVAYFPVRSDGSWSGLFTVLPETPPGTYAVSASCSAGRSYFSLPRMQIVVAGEPVQTAPTATELPRTGAPIGATAASGAASLLAGLGMLLGSRTRRGSRSRDRRRPHRPLWRQILAIVASI